MNTFKKNQIVVYAISLMLVVAGYLNYIENDRTVEISSTTRKQNTNIGDATLVNSNEVEVNNDKIEENNNEIEINSNEVEVNSDKNSFSEYFTNSKIEREKMYSQMLETYQKMTQNTSISEEQKSIATQEIKKINDTKNAIMICENLISTKGFNNSLVLANAESINVVVEADELTQEQIAQIQNIITREMNTEIENIHIMKR